MVLYLLGLLIHSDIDDNRIVVLRFLHIKRFFLQTTIDEGYAILSHTRMPTSIFHKNSLIILKNNTIKIYKLTPKQAIFAALYVGLVS
jgi:hypothetical protein